MKTKLIALAVIVAGVVFVAYSQKSDTALSSSSQPNRYKFYSSGSGQYPNEYLLDTQTGRLWRYTVDQANNTMVMYPVTFESIEKTMSLIPNEQTTDVVITKPSITTTNQ